MSNDAKPVYSTEKGRISATDSSSALKKESAQKKSDRQSIRVGRETKGRKGAGVTVITGLPLSENELKTLLSALKKRLGCGGTLRDGVLEFQGEHRDVLLVELQKLGFTAKKSGN